MSSTAAAGRTIAGFRLQSVIGEGAMGTVYLAGDEHGGRVAVKLLAPQLAQDERFRRRFLRESQLAAALDHPNIVPVLDASEHEGVLYLAMRFVDGVDLRELLRREGRLDAERALHLLAQVADALDAAHAAGLVHRDVKPGNVLVTPGTDGEQAYICDFGLARHVSTASSLTTDRGLVGTIDYIPPEQIEGASVDGRADVYSLGCMLFECLTGARPFERESDLSVVFAHLNEPPPRVSELRPDLPRTLDGVVATALAKSPAARYATSGELIAAARAALEGRRIQRRRPRARVLLAAALVPVATAAVVGGLLLRKDQPVPPGPAITATSIGGARLGLRATDYKRQLGAPWETGRHVESEHVTLTFPKQELAVYFKGLTDTAVEITTWNRAYRTAAGVGPCSTLKELKRAYGKRLKPSEFNTINGVVFAYKVGETLLFASNDQRIVETVALYYGDAPDALEPGGSLSFAGFVALSSTRCG
jgi:hypothetical protein